jgi:ribokinase
LTFLKPIGRIVPVKAPLSVTEQTNKNIVLIGNLNIDLIIRNVPHMPGWGQEVLGSDYIVASSGQSAYTAFALSKLHVGTRIVSSVGDDEYGDRILEDLKRNGIDISSVQRIVTGNTGITVAIVREDGERAFVSDPSSLTMFDMETVRRNLGDLGTAAIVGIVGSFFLPRFRIRDIGACFTMAHEAGCQTLLDTGWDPGNWSVNSVRELRDNLRHADFFIPNMDEARAITARETPEGAAETLLSDGCGTVIIKLGEGGSYLRTVRKEIFVPSFKTHVFDAVGAGDVYNAGFIFGTLQKWPLEARMIFGSATAAHYISQQSDRFPDLSTILNLASNNPHYSFMEREQ